ncbi:hypothetical protein I4U23_018808 [Adineta vaga]|nr:hypothetical protein I4U23_018808 [Adineta vaga]
MNNDQRKAAICFVRQLNTYIDQRSVALQKFIGCTKDSIDTDENSTVTLELISKSNPNDICRNEKNNSIDISKQLSDDCDYSIKSLIYKNDDLFAFYNRTICNQRNQQTSVVKYEVKSVSDGYCSNLSKNTNKIHIDTFDHVPKQTKLINDIEFCDDVTADFTIMNIEPVKDMLTVSSKQIKESVDSTEKISNQDFILITTEPNIQQPSTINNSQLTNEPPEQLLSTPVNSRCIVSFAIVWLDSSAADSSERIHVQKELRVIDEQLKTFNDVLECEKHLRNQPAHYHIILIVNGTLGMQLVPKIDNLSQIKDIYVYCVRGVFIDFNLLHQQLLPDHIPPEVHRTSSEQATATADILTTANVSTTTPLQSEQPTTAASQQEQPATTVSQPEQPTTAASQQEQSATTASQPEQPATTVSQSEQSTTSTALSEEQQAIPSTAQESITTVTETQLSTNKTTSSELETNYTSRKYSLDLTYMIAESCFDCICRMKSLSEEIEDYILFCRESHKDNEAIYPFIREFQDKYSPEKAVSCLCMHPFFNGFLDIVFKLAHIVSVFICRVFIQDIQKQLEERKCTAPIQAFRYESISNEDFEELKSLNGKVICMKHFFWTTTDLEKARSFISDTNSNNECKRILFTVDADPQIKNAKPFAKLISFVDTYDPTEVVFMIGSLFKITKIEDVKDEIINVQLTLCANEDNNELKTQIDQIKQQYIDSNGEIDAVGFGQFVIALGNSLRERQISESGENVIRGYHEKLTQDHPDHIRCCHALGNLDFVKGDYDSSLACYNKLLELKTKSSSGDDLGLAKLHNDIASVYYEKEDFEQALSHFHTAGKLWKILKSDDDIILVPCYTNMGNIYEKQEKWIDAFCCYSQAEMILVKHNATNEFSFALSCNNLGNLHFHLHRYHLALGYYQTSLDIKLKVLPSIDPSIAITYRNIGIIYKSMNNLQQSRATLEKAVEIYRQTQSSDNANITEIEQIIRDLPNEST